ncbi:Holliday junction resolvase RecU [Bacillus sp. FJAT-42376]|uniref:Holliday junction resolvase RecU n=1 Tax=Bacillus sp. FJAT-42376 TaxID=2014076 RepID=UPI000F4FF5E0|nr:Holliday junction resolvase RecU [Bacillus sp. FJAT-42376]AZB43299.1 Holliday junction resolvase RecU [Bacillus sp. FJAT-42376]
MTYRYPNGKIYSPAEKERAPAARKSNSIYSNRGMTLEEDLNETNQFYLNRGIAVVHKKPTPVQIVNVDYPRRSAAVIKEAYFKQSSTTDYNGIYKGRYLDFEAKETKNASSFPLQNFHGHQISHMKQVLDQDGICFVILSAFGNIYLLPANHLIGYWNRRESGGRKSITKLEIEENGFRIPLGLHPRIDYIKVLDALYFN